MFSYKTALSVGILNGAIPILELKMGSKYDFLS